MIVIPVKIICDYCLENSCQHDIEADLTLMKFGNTLKRLLSTNYSDKINNLPSGWSALEIESAIKIYCPACKELFANQQEEDL